MSVNRPAITILTAVIMGHMAVFWGLSQLTPPVLSQVPQPVKVRVIPINSSPAQSADTPPAPRSNTALLPQKNQPTPQPKTAVKADVQPITPHPHPPIQPRPAQQKPAQKPPQAIIQPTTDAQPILSTRASTHKPIQTHGQNHANVAQSQHDEPNRINDEQTSTTQQQRTAEQQKIEQQKIEQQRFEEQRSAEQFKVSKQQSQHDEQPPKVEQHQKSRVQTHKISTGELSWSRPPQYDTEMIAQYLPSQQGKKQILIQINVDAQGIISDAKIVQGSGIAKLDDYVLRQTKKARSTPYHVNGVATAFTTHLPTTFETHDSDF